MIESLAPRAAAEPVGGLGGHGLVHEHALFAGLAVLFAVLVGALFLWFRRAARASEVEEIDRMLDED